MLGLDLQDDDPVEVANPEGEANRECGVENPMRDTSRVLLWRVCCLLSEYQHPRNEGTDGENDQVRYCTHQDFSSFPICVTVDNITSFTVCQDIVETSFVRGWGIWYNMKAIYD